MQGFYEKLLCKYHHYLQKDPEDLAVISQFTDSFMPPFTTPQVLKPKGEDRATAIPNAGNNE